MAQVKINDTQLQELRKNYPSLAGASDDALVAYAIASYNYQQEKKRNQPKLPIIKR